jgi:hypothetical protein
VIFGKMNQGDCILPYKNLDVGVGQHEHDSRLAKFEPPYPNQCRLKYFSLNIGQPNSRLRGRGGEVQSCREVDLEVSGCAELEYEVLSFRCREVPQQWCRGSAE